MYTYVYTLCLGLLFGKSWSCPSGEPPHPFSVQPTVASGGHGTGALGGQGFGRVHDLLRSNAWRNQLLLAWHPDKTAVPEAAEVTRELNLAKAVLTDAMRRAAYGREVSNPLGKCWYCKMRGHHFWHHCNGWLQFMLEVIEASRTGSILFQQGCWKLSVQSTTTAIRGLVITKGMSLG